MRNWKWFLMALSLAALLYLYFDERQFVERMRPWGFSTDTPAGSIFVVRLQKNLEVRKARVGQTIRLVPADVLPYGSTNDALLPADAVLEARIRRILSDPKGRHVMIFEFERLRAGGRVIPLSAFLTVKSNAGAGSEQLRREMHGSLGAFIARSAQDNPLTVLAGYLSGTYFGGFWSRQVDAPASFFSDELGRTVPSSLELHVQLHRRAFIPR
jgi:hypothetical protein